MQIPENSPDVVDLNSDAFLLDRKAKKEEEDIGISEAEFLNIQRKRNSNFYGHVHKVSVILVYVVSAIYFLATFTWLWHLIFGFEKSYSFMVESHYPTLQSLLFGTIVGGLASQFARKIFNPSP